MSVAKALVQLVMTVLAALVPALTSGPLGAAGWVNVVVLAAGVVMVYNASNDVPGWTYAKLVASFVSAVAVVLLSALTDGAITPAEIIQMILAGAAAVGVGAIPNGTPARPRAA